MLDSRRIMLNEIHRLKVFLREGTTDMHARIAVSACIFNLKVALAKLPPDPTDLPLWDEQGVPV